jgi:hypothetical protein
MEAEGDGLVGDGREAVVLAAGGVADKYLGPAGAGLGDGEREGNRAVGIYG